MKTVYDYAIVGSGCSGLSLAGELATRLPADDSLALIDNRLTYGMDRLWCYWSVMPHPFSAAVRHVWHRFKVRYNASEIVLSSDRYPYHYIPADAFYQEAFRMIAQHARTSWHLGVSAASLSEAEDLVQIETGNGDILARRVFDGRVRPADIARWNCLLQHYGGQIVETDDPVFDAKTITLMDFDVPQTSGIAFVYVLPFTATKALVEPTFFSENPFDADRYRASIRSYLQNRYGLKHYRVAFEEKGVIPMQPDPMTCRRSRRVFRIGTLGGMVKGSTGYGFLAIQRWTPMLAAHVLERSDGDVQVPRSRFAAWLDAVFVSHIRRYPQQAPELFFNLFRRVQSDALIRFLSDMATPADYAAVIRAMPIWPMIRSAVKHTVSRSRS